MAMTEAEMCRFRIDEAVRALWQMFRMASDHMPLTDQDADLWARVAMHPAIQDRIDAAFGTKGGKRHA